LGYDSYTVHFYRKVIWSGFFDRQNNDLGFFPNLDSRPDHDSLLATVIVLGGSHLYV
jgi:hypothetical protein